MFKYETHLHTKESSRCGSTSAAEYPAYYKSLGYSGIFITDHFLTATVVFPMTFPGKTGSICSAAVMNWQKKPEMPLIFLYFRLGSQF